MSKAAEAVRGDWYGLLFPITLEQLNSQAYGAAWLTRAFHAAGTLEVTLTRASVHSVSSI